VKVGDRTAIRINCVAGRGIDSWLVNRFAPWQYMFITRSKSIKMRVWAIHHSGKYIFVTKPRIYERPKNTIPVKTRRKVYMPDGLLLRDLYPGVEAHLPDTRQIHVPLPETLGAPTLVQEDDGTVHQLPLRFNGPAYDPALDQVRLTGQALRVFRMMKGGSWWCLWEISQRTGDPEASISAQLRHLRKPRFGGHTVNKRRRGEPGHGWWEYQLVVRR